MHKKQIPRQLGAGYLLNEWRGGTHFVTSGGFVDGDGLETILPWSLVFPALHVYFDLPFSRQMLAERGFNPILVQEAASLPN